MYTQFSVSLSCIDLSNIQKSIEQVNQLPIDYLHYDMVDGQFNDCFIFGDILLPIFKSLSSIPLCVHLACVKPSLYIPTLLRAKVDEIALHYESEDNIIEIAKMLRRFGVHPKLAFRASTPPPNNLLSFRSYFDGILKLTVNPGYAGQDFQPKTLEHIRQLRTQLGPHYLIEADGHVNKDTINTLYKAGANAFTLGSSGLFYSDQLLNNLNHLKNII